MYFCVCFFFLRFFLLFLQKAKQCLATLINSYDAKWSCGEHAKCDRASNWMAFTSITKSATLMRKWQPVLDYQPKLKCTLCNGAHLNGIPNSHGSCSFYGDWSPGMRKMPWKMANQRWKKARIDNAWTRNCRCTSEKQKKKYFGEISSHAHVDWNPIQWNRMGHLHQPNSNLLLCTQFRCACPALHENV